MSKFFAALLVIVGLLAALLRQPSVVVSQSTTLESRVAALETRVSKLEPTVIPTRRPTVAPTVTPLPTTTPEQAWYSGGTLHDKTAADWLAADDRDRLATSADWAYFGFDLEPTSAETFSAEVMPYAIVMRDCVQGLIDMSAKEPELIKLPELAALCATYHAK